ncbi:MAG: SDR family oxidoreductase [Sphingobacteriia bacterium]|nr:SDR family oxidoreductase [Sphingobacteriia bacterium]
MKILLTGCNGFLGQHLTKYLSTKGLSITALGRGDCKISEEPGLKYQSIELTNSDAVKKLFSEESYDVIIHNAAMSKPDECELNREACINNNVRVTEYLLQHAALNTHFIYISTDFVFGEGGPHSETSVPAPLNFYGESKLMAEQLVQQYMQQYTIVRPVFIYGPTNGSMRPSFLHWVQKNLKEGKCIKVVNDQLRTPTFVTDICAGIATIIQQKSTGIFHLAGKDILSPYQMALTVADMLNLDKELIEGVDAVTFKEPVQRAKRSGLTIDRAREVLGYCPLTFEEGVRRTFMQ